MTKHQAQPYEQAACEIRLGETVTFLKDGHRVSAKRSLILPEIAKPLGRKFAISNRMLDVLVAEIVLQRSSIHALIGQLEPS